MKRHDVRLVSALATATILAVSALAYGQGTPTANLSAPDYGASSLPGSLAGSFNTPTADGRPGEKFFAYAVQAYRKGDYAHAVDMYKLAAYWAYAPAAYNLGVMYYRGEGVPADRPLGAAWMVIAAQQGNPRYALVRDQMVTLLTHAEFAETDRLFGRLQPKYGEQVTMRRAKARWAYARSQKTGSRVGGDAGELWVGANDGPVSRNRKFHTGKTAMYESGFGYLPDGSVSGAVAYRQFQQSDKPYSPSFEQHRKGSATVGPLEEIRQPAAKPKTRPDGQPPTAGQPAA